MYLCGWKPNFSLPSYCLFVMISRASTAGRHLWQDLPEQPQVTIQAPPQAHARQDARVLFWYEPVALKTLKALKTSERDGTDPAGQTHGIFISISCSWLISSFEEGKNKQNHALGPMQPEHSQRSISSSCLVTHLRHVLAPENDVQ